jgi:hypothetical protein
VEITKSVHSSFLGTPGPAPVARHRRAIRPGGDQRIHEQPVLARTTAAFAGDLGYDVLFALDATHTFDEGRPDGRFRLAGGSRAVNSTATIAHVMTTGDLVG